MAKRRATPAQLRNLAKGRATLRRMRAGKPKRSRSVSTPRTTKTKVVYRMAKHRKAKSKGGSRPIFKLGSARFHKSDLYLVAGMAGAGALGGVVNQVSGGRLTGNAAQAGAGVFLAMVGGKIGGQIGKGVLLKTGADLVEDNLIPMILGSFGSSSSATSTQGNGATF